MSARSVAIILLAPVVVAVSCRVGRSLTCPPVRGRRPPRWPAPRVRKAARHVRPRGIGVAVATASAGVVLGPITAAAVALGGGVVLPRWTAMRRRSRSARRLAADLPDVIDVLVTLVGAGLPLHEAIAVLGERGPPTWRAPFATAIAAHRSGLSLADALDVLSATAGAVARPVADALASAQRYGHPLGPVLERLAADGRAMRRRNAEATARQLPVRLSFPLVCCTLPSFVLLTIAPLIAGALSSISISGGPP